MIATLLFDFSWVLAFPPSQQNDVLELNDELIEFVKQQPKLNSYIFSASSKRMLEKMRGSLTPPFIEIFSSKELSIYKHRSESYQQIAKIMNTAPEKILFIDDSESNIEAAKAAGIQTIHYQNNQDFIKKFQLIVNSN